LAAEKRGKEDDAFGVMKKGGEGDSRKIFGGKIFGHGEGGGRYPSFGEDKEGYNSYFVARYLIVPRRREGEGGEMGRIVYFKLSRGEKGKKRGGDY